MVAQLERDANRWLPDDSWWHLEGLLERNQRMDWLAATIENEKNPPRVWLTVLDHLSHFADPPRPEQLRLYWDLLQRGTPVDTAFGAATGVEL